MPEITIAADETAATSLVAFGQTALGTVTDSGSGSLGPFTATYNAALSLSGGAVDLRAPDIIRLTNCSVNYSLNFTFTIDLNRFLPRLCLPRICITLPFIGTVCTPEVCIPWPIISVPVNHSSSVLFTSDFKLAAALVGANWEVSLIIVGIPSLQLGPAATALLVALGFAVSAALLLVPFIGPFLALAASIIVGAIGIAGITGLLGPILTPFVAGTSIPIGDPIPRNFILIPADGADAAVDVLIDSLSASVISSDEDELVLTADISP